MSAFLKREREAYKYVLEEREREREKLTSIVFKREREMERVEKKI